MGLFDRIRCNYPMPLDGANALTYQTKDTPAQLLDNYEIRGDGTLWHQSVDYDDGANSPFEPVRFTGDIRFYGRLVPSGWVEWLAIFAEGRLTSLSLIENRST